MRLTLSWRSASRLPANIEAMAMAATTRKSVAVWSPPTGLKKRSSSAKTAPFETVATRPATGAGAPW